VLAPMAGTVVEVRASAGQRVSEGDVLFVLESMKMQMSVLCPAAGVVTAVFVQAAEVLSGPEPLASIETANE
jgi:biotin carboxyl carrier protein